MNKRSIVLFGIFSFLMAFWGGFYISDYRFSIEKKFDFNNAKSEQTKKELVLIYIGSLELLQKNGQ